MKSNLDLSISQTKIAKFKEKILEYNGVNTDFLLIENDKYRIYYAPFDYINTDAKIIIVGITPGRQQMENMLIEAQRLFKEGKSEEVTERECKHVGSFSGPLRKNLCKMMDSVGINNKIGIEKTETLFDEDKNLALAHFTSCVRYPVFKLKKGKEENFNGDVSKIQFLYDYAEEMTRDEMSRCKDALILPLGEKVHNYLTKALHGTEAESRILPWIPHPSGANSVRISYFLNKKSNPDDVSKKKLDDQRKLFLDIMK